MDIPANLYEDEVVCFMADRYRDYGKSDAMFLVQEAGGPRLKGKLSLSASRITNGNYEGC